MTVNPKPKRIRNTKLLAEIRTKPCLACGHMPSDAAHVKSKGSGGDDVESNLLPLCRVHHCEQHKIGFIRFMEMYSKIRIHLFDLGWYVDAEGKLKRDKV